MSVPQEGAKAGALIRSVDVRVGGRGCKHLAQTFLTASAPHPLNRG